MMVGPRTRLGAVLLLALGVPAAGQAPAPSPAACTGFAWPLLREQAWFSAPGLPRLESGATLSAAMPGALLVLRPVAEADLPLPPSRAPNPGTYAGVLRLEPPMVPGTYQVTLSDRAWIDVSQDGKTMRPSGAHTAQQGCPDLAKSVRFQLGTAPVTVIVSGAKAESIKIAVAPAE